MGESGKPGGMGALVGCLVGCGLAFLLLVLLVAGLAGGLTSFLQEPMEGPGAEAHGPAEPDLPPDAVRVLFLYGSEKKKWIREVTGAYNAAEPTVADGRRVYIDAVPMGSGESIDDVLAGHRKAHILSPASGAFIKLGNARSQAKAGGPLLGPTRPLVLSPVVIAMWKPMAEALGWGERPLGWSDIIDLARDEKGWGAHGHPEWGRFKFGHTHPEYSNSGLISLLAETYAGAQKTRELTLEDVRRPEVGAYLRSVEAAVVHYGRSTGFFGRKMFGRGPGYLSAAVLYESMVVESYAHEPPLPMPVVAIYPKEGTFWSDHPAGIVERPWVTASHREAAEAYLDHLLEAPQQAQALRFGFRPASVDVAVAAPIDAAHGVDPQQPQTVLEVPSADVMQAILDLWRENKKHARIVLVLDVSGSMRGEKLRNAKEGANALIDLLGKEDLLSLVPFSSGVHWVLTDAPMAKKREEARRRVEGLIADGGTALYDATHAAVGHLFKNPAPGRIEAVVVLTDGADSGSRIPFDALLRDIRTGGEGPDVRVFTIGYGAGAQADQLEAVAESTAAKFYKGNPATIREVFREISTFF